MVERDGLAARPRHGNPDQPARYEPRPYQRCLSLASGFVGSGDHLARRALAVGRGRLGADRRGLTPTEPLGQAGGARSPLHASVVQGRKTTARAGGLALSANL